MLEGARPFIGIAPTGRALIPPAIIVERGRTDNTQVIRSFRVLVVSEQRAEREFLARVLRQPDYEIVSAASGNEALQLVELHEPFDLLLADLEIPGLEGFELARRIRAIDPAIKILYLTREVDLLFEERTALWDEEAFLEKPLTAQGVLEAVSLILVGHIPPPRPIRVHVAGALVRFEHQIADLVRFSVTGALAQAIEPVDVGSVCRIALEFPGETLQVDGRVVSCERLAPAPRDASLPPRPYAIALAFVDPSPRSLKALERIVHEAWQARQARSSPGRGPIKA